MSKIKMRCITCGKWFQSANAKEVTCPDCLQKARKEKMAAKTTPPTSPTTGQGTVTPTRQPAPAARPKPTSGGSSHWLDNLNDVKVGQPEQPVRPKQPPTQPPRENRGEPEKPDQQRPGGYHEERNPGAHRSEREPGGYSRGPNNHREGDYRGPGAYRVGGLGTGTIGQRPRQPMEGRTRFDQRPAFPGEARPEKAFPRETREKREGKPASAASKGHLKPVKPAPAPKPKREKIPPPKPFEPTPEQINKVIARYQELAVPSEFDGIRTQISKELEIPKVAVKNIIKDYRNQLHIPSWWELQTYKGDPEELEKIKAAYEPYLPVPPVGVHRKIADELSLKPSTVYQAIKTIRQELSLPQFNNPELHGQDLPQVAQGEQVQRDSTETEIVSTASEAVDTVVNDSNKSTKE